MIPKKIHLIYFSDENNSQMPNLYQFCYNEIIDIYNDYDVRLYNKQDCLNLITEYYPEYIDAYNSFEYDIQKIDFMKLLFVYHYGGFYMDLDMMPILSLDDLLEYDLIVCEEFTINNEEKERLNLKYNVRVANFMFGAIDHNSFLLDALTTEQERSSIKISSKQELLDLTGPGLFTDTLFDNFKTYNNVRFLTKKLNRGFGQYAEHLSSKRWEKNTDMDKLLNIYNTINVN